MDEILTKEDIDQILKSIGLFKKQNRFNRFKSKLINLFKKLIGRDHFQYVCWASKEEQEATLAAWKRLVETAEAGNHLDKYTMIRVKNPYSKKLYKTRPKGWVFGASEHYLDFCIWKKDSGIHQGVWVAEEMNGGYEYISGIANTKEDLVQDLIKLGREFFEEEIRYRKIKCNVRALAERINRWNNRRIDSEWKLDKWELKKLKKHKKEIAKWEFFNCGHRSICIWKKESGVYADKWVGFCDDERSISWVADTKESLVKSLKSITKEYLDELDRSDKKEDTEGKWRSASHHKFTNLISEEERKKFEY